MPKKQTSIMREKERFSMKCKFSFWVILLYMLIVALTNYHQGVNAFELVEQSGVYNFVVAVKSNGGVCTGTIVSKEWILTAAHCLLHDGEVMSNEDVKILAGVIDYEYPREDVGQFRESVEIKMHPSFMDDMLAKYDLALVRVNESFKFNNFVGSIKIAGDSYPPFINQTDQCMSLGFGGEKELDSDEQKALKIWNVTALYGPDTCVCSRRFQYKRLVCSKDPEYSRLCKGDDGGPLVCGNVVRGIAHMVRNFHTCEDPEYPMENCIGSPDKGLSIYSLLCPANDWMHEIVPEIPPTPATCRAQLMASSLLAVIVFLFYFLIIRN